MTTTVALHGVDLSAIAQSGQCFRMTADHEGCWLYSGAERVFVRRREDDKCAFDCDEDALKRLWLPYLDEGTDYAAIVQSIDPEDEALVKAADYSKGLRILRQDPFEALICFIISQRRSIASIRGCVDKLCRAFGERCEDAYGEYYAFPTPKALAEAQERALLDCSVGYRAKYIQAAARRIALGEETLGRLALLPDDALKQSLLAFYGVGEKVASCVMLFGFHRLNAFPVDVWVDRVEKRYYDGRFPVERYLGAAGVMQQYLFHAVIHGVIEG